jgi:hypothetical protein
MAFGTPACSFWPFMIPFALTVEQAAQVDRGHLQGRLTHFLIGGLPFDLGTFSLGVRSRGVASEDRITISMLTRSTNRVTHRSHEMQPSDVFIWPPGAERYARYYGGASVLFAKTNPYAKRVHVNLLNMLMTPFQLAEFAKHPDVDRAVDEFSFNALEDYHAAIEGGFLQFLEQALSGSTSFYYQDKSCMIFLYASAAGIISGTGTCWD